MKYKLIVFDWDGTLMDSQARIVDCMRAAILDAGLALPDDARISEIIGLGLPEAVQRLLPDAHEAVMDRVITRYRHHFLTENRTVSPLFEGVEETLRQLTQRGYLLAVATGKGRSGLERALRETGLGGYFQATRCADECRSKPAPDMLDEIMDELGMFAPETLMVGDTEYDLEMAANARTAALAVGYGVHDRQRLLAHAPIACVDDIREIPALIDAEPETGKVAV